jgi:hypothetical protein
MATPITKPIWSPGAGPAKPLFQVDPQTWQGLLGRAFQPAPLPTTPPTLGDQEAELRALQMELQRTQAQRALQDLDPRQPLYRQADQLSYQTGLMQSPMYAEYRRLRELEEAPQRAHELAKFQLQYGLPSETRMSIAQLEQATREKIEGTRAEARMEAERLRQQLNLIGRMIAAQAARDAARTRGAASVAGTGAAVRPSELPALQEWFSRMAGGAPSGGGDVVAFSELYEFAQQTGADVYSLIQEAMQAGRQIDFSR